MANRQADLLVFTQKLVHEDLIAVHMDSDDILMYKHLRENGEVCVPVCYV